MTKTFALESVDGRMEEVLREVEAGNTAELTRSGEPVAVILSLHEYHQLAAGQPAFRDALDRFLASRAESVEPLEDSDLEGLRDRSPGREAAL
jgi:prevent-host-death family protein